MKKTAMILTTALVTVFASSAFAEDFLGQTKLGMRSDSDMIYVSDCNNRFDGRYSQIRLQVKDAGVDLQELSIQYGNGNWERVLSGVHFGRGTKSRWYSLRGAADRCVRQILVRGDASASLFPRQAKVQVFAR